MYKSLYIHIPFCNNICKYCDFLRFKCDNITKKKYIEKIISQIKDIKHKLKTIYIGGGTPNSLDNYLLNKLLNCCSKLCTKDTEFTIECNPEFICKEQINIFKKNKVNRISLGIQTVNPIILKKMNRFSDLKKIKESINLLKKNNINNISCDFIYGFNELNLKDLDDSIKFIKLYKIPHVSFYSLEVKKGSALYAQNYQTNEEKIENQLIYINKMLLKNGFNRYEVSNWTLKPKYESEHNKAYWKMLEWKGIGLGAYGYENNIYYTNTGTLKNWKQKKENIKDMDLVKLIMGLRMKQGIFLDSKNKEIYQKYKDKLKNIYIKNNHLICKDLDILNQCFIDLI